MKKIWWLSCMIVFLTALSPVVILADNNVEEPDVLVVYSNETGEMDENQRKLDMLLTHFTKEIKIISVDEFKKSDLNGVTHLVYQGMKKHQLPKVWIRAVDEYEGKVAVFGYNQEQLGSRYRFAEANGEKTVHSFYLTQNENTKFNSSVQSIHSIKPGPGSDVLVKAVGGDHTHPMITKQENSYYIGVTNLMSDSSIPVGEVLHTFFNMDHEHQHPGYIRLEDVHPLVDPVKLRAVADVLIDRDIPFMIAVIPVYTNPDTGKQSHLSDYPEVLKTLKYMQNNGGSVVLHGYTHQYHATETGEGFEFWDVKNNTPIYKDAAEDTPLKIRADFSNAREYEAHREEQKDFERTYINRKLSQGIRELNSFGLKPLAFEAPHYTMSQNGYRTVSASFSTYVGQVQLSDKNWEVMDSVPYKSSPSFFHGMSLLPETSGYVDPDNEKSADEIAAKAEKQMFLRDGMVSFFYHPYLGPERLVEVLDQIDHLPVNWIDMNKEDAIVTSGDLTIEAVDGEVKTNQTIIASTTDTRLGFTYFLKTSAEKIMWSMVGTVIPVLIFFIAAAFLSKRRITKEERRRHIG